MTTAFTKLPISMCPVDNLQALAEEEKVSLWFCSDTYRPPEPCCATIDQTSNKISTTGSLTSTLQVSSVTGYLHQRDLRVMYKQKILREHYIEDEGKCPTRLWSGGDKHTEFTPSIIKPFQNQYSETSHRKGYEDVELLIRSKN